MELKIISLKFSGNHSHILKIMKTKIYFQELFLLTFNLNSRKQFCSSFLRRHGKEICQDLTPRIFTTKL